MENSLVIFSKAALMLAEADTIQKAHELKDLALTAADWARRKGMGKKVILHCRSYALEAERKMGEMLAVTDRSLGGRPNKTSDSAAENQYPGDTGLFTLAELDLTKKESSEAQLIASLSREVFDQLISDLEKITRKVIIREAKERKREEECAAKIATGHDVKLPLLLSLKAGDFREVLKDVSANSVDLIFTDPPYSEEYINLWNDLGEVAARILKPSGMLIAYSGNEFLPQVLDILRKHLTYSWLAGIYHTGGHIQIWKHKVWNQWKPIVVFTKGKEGEHDWYLDMFYGKKGDKVAHDWAQGEREAAYYIEKLTNEGDYVIDPMCGSGTIPRAAFQLKRKALGIDINAENIEIAKGGLNGKTSD